MSPFPSARSLRSTTDDASNPIKSTKHGQEEMLSTFPGSHPGTTLNDPNRQISNRPSYAKNRLQTNIFNFEFQKWLANKNYLPFLEPNVLSDMVIQSHNSHRGLPTIHELNNILGVEIMHARHEAGTGKFNLPEPFVHRFNRDIFSQRVVLPQFVEHLPRSTSVPFLSLASPLPARRRSTLRQRLPISPVFRGISTTNKFDLEAGSSRHEMELLSSSLACSVPRRRSAKSMVNWLVHDASPETSSGSSEVHPGSTAMLSYLQEATNPGSTFSGLRARGSSLTGSSDTGSSSKGSSIFTGSLVGSHDEQPGHGIKARTDDFNCMACSGVFTHSSRSIHQKQCCARCDRLTSTLVSDGQAQTLKDFACRQCSKSYASVGAMKMHTRTHTLPCRCQVCGKAFSRPWLLQGHVRTHTGEKPFECGQCGRAFADRSNLRAHLQTHAQVKKYRCNLCSKTFSRMSLLLKHKTGSCPASETLVS